MERISNLDDNLSNYSYGELVVMRNRINSGSRIGVNVSLNEIIDEMETRTRVGNFSIMEMSLDELMEYREKIVGQYIGELDKPFWYFDKLIDIDILIKHKS